MIDPEDSNLLPPSLDDFPTPDIQAEIFIQWVRVCGIIGKIGKYLLRAADLPHKPFPRHLAEEMMDWVEALPEHLSLPVSTDRTITFNRDVHQLHLPYLTVIILLHLKPTSQRVADNHSGPVMAASCIARIMRDFLARGSFRFLSAITCWYCGIASLALLHARRIESLTRIVDSDIRTLQAALDQLKIMWPSANIFIKGIERLQEAYPVVENSQRSSIVSSPVAPPEVRAAEQTIPRPAGDGVENINWIRYFPTVTVQTSAVASVLLTEPVDEQFQDSNWYGEDGPPLQLDDFFDPFQGSWTPLQFSLPPDWGD